MVITIAGKQRWLWRAVVQDGYVLDAVVQTRRNTKAARRLLTHLLRKQGIAPKWMITDKLRSHGAARRQVMPHVEHRSHKGLNNRAEKFSWATAKTGADDSRLPIIRQPSALRLYFLRCSYLFVRPYSQRSAFQKRVQRIQAIAEWKAAAGAQGLRSILKAEVSHASEFKLR